MSVKDLSIETLNQRVEASLTMLSYGWLSDFVLEGASSVLEEAIEELHERAMADHLVFEIKVWIQNNPRTLK